MNIVAENLQTHKPLNMLCANLLSIYLLHVRFNLRTVVAEPVGYGALFEIISIDYVRFTNRVHNTWVQ